MARRRMIDLSWKERYFKKQRIPQGVRNQVILRDHFTCQYCGKKGIFENFHGRFRVYEIVGQDGKIPFEIDHVVPEFLGGKNDVENLKLACRRCNRSKGARHGKKANDRSQHLE